MQVRIIAATLVDVGHGRLSVERLAAALANQDRDALPKAAPSLGLYLEAVWYPHTQDLMLHR